MFIAPRLVSAAVTVALAAAAPLPVAASPSVAPSPSVAGAAPCPMLQPETPIVFLAPRPVPAAANPVVLGGEQLAATGLVVPPGAPEVPATMLRATSWLVADLDSGEVLGACGPHVRGAPASLQKLLLVATVLPKLDPTDVVTVTKEDLDFKDPESPNYERADYEWGGLGVSDVGAKLNHQYTVDTLFHGLLLQSGNDTANVLARVAGGDRGRAGTMADMNAEAHRLGAIDTYALTPSGLDALSGESQYTTVYDLALIFRACFQQERFRSYIATEAFQFQDVLGEGFQIQNDNQLLYNYAGALGGKTGFTDVAMHTFVGAAEQDGRRLMVALLGAEKFVAGTSYPPPWQQTAALLDWGFSLPPGASVGQLVTPEEAQLALNPPHPSADPLVLTPAGADRPLTPLVTLAALGAVLLVLLWALAANLRRRRAPAVAMPVTVVAPTAPTPTPPVATDPTPPDTQP